MDTCRGEVLPYSPDVIKGLKAFKIGLCVAFGLASLSHVVISNIRKDGSSEKDGARSATWSDAMSRFFSLALHMVPLLFIFLREWNGMHWDSYSVREGRIQKWEESVTLTVFTGIILARSAATSTSAMFAFGCFIALLAALRSTRDEATGAASFCLAVVGFVLLCVVLFRGSSRGDTHEDGYTRYVEYKSGANVLRGAFLVLAAFQLVLHHLQVNQMLDSELCALCGALLTGGARHVYTVVCHDNAVELQLALEECKYMHRSGADGSVGDSEGDELTEGEEVTEEEVDEEEQAIVEECADISTTIAARSAASLPDSIGAAGTNTAANTTTTSAITAITDITASAPPQRRHSTPHSPHPPQSSHHLHVAFTASTNTSPVPTAESHSLADTTAHCTTQYPVQNASSAYGSSNHTHSSTTTAQNTATTAHHTFPHALHTHTHSDLGSTHSAFRRAGSSVLTDTTEATSRRQLLRYVFHEMRAPLNSISMAVDLLTHHSKKGTPKSKFLDLEALQIIEEATLTMERTLKDTMTLQKIDEGSLVAQLRIFSLYNMCDDIKDALKQVLRSNSVSLNVSIDAQVPDQIVGDHFRIRHVVAHVLSNAIKFSRAGGAVNLRVQVRNGASSTSGDSVYKGSDTSRSIGAGGVGSGSRRDDNALQCSSLGFLSSSTDIGDLDLFNVAEYDLCPSDRGSMDLRDVEQAVYGGARATSGAISGAGGGVHANASASASTEDGVVYNVSADDDAGLRDSMHRESLYSASGGMIASGGATNASSRSSSAASRSSDAHRTTSTTHSHTAHTTHTTHTTHSTHTPVQQYIVISITDNGVGMSPELQESDIFKPFNQLKTEEITGFRGTGLGLAICKKIITFLQGSITYSSVAGVGTTFKICFPLTLLDTDSMDQVEEEDLPDIELAQSSDAYDCNVHSGGAHSSHVYGAQTNAQNFQNMNYTPGMQVLGSPQTARHKAIARAKSFRGEKLLSILHNQSNVFDCPTPVSLSQVHSSSKLSSVDDWDNSGGNSGGHSGGNSGGHSHEITPAESPRVSPAPCFEDSGNGSPERRTTAATTTASASASATASPTTYKHKTHSPPRPSVRALPGAQGDPSDSNSCSRILPGALNINTTAGHSSTAPSSNKSNSYAHSAHSLFYPDDTSPTFHSLHSLQSSPIAATRSTDDYISLTEKNVNLHILRTAATDGLRALKTNKSAQQGTGGRKVTTKEALMEMLQASKILVVDDAPSNRKLLSMMLKRAGFGTIDLVEDGQAAVDYCRALAEEDQPRIIFMDNTMPRMTGIEASKVIRQGGYPFLIIGVTGNSLEEELDEFIASGADLVIVKPLKNQSLELLLGFIQTNGFDSSHGYRIDMVGKEYSWVPRGTGRY